MYKFFINKYILQAARIYQGPELQCLLKVKQDLS